MSTVGRSTGTGTGTGTAGEVLGGRKHYTARAVQSYSWSQKRMGGAIEIGSRNERYGNERRSQGEIGETGCKRSIGTGSL